MNPRRKKTAPLPAGRPIGKRLWFFRLSALLLPFILLGLLETGLRLAGYGYDTRFFKRLNIDGKEYWVQNDDFSYRFFPPENARNPGVIRLPVRKEPGTFRIFIFGESAAMGDPEPAYGAGRYLEMLLAEKFPGVKFEIANVAFTAINSHVIVPIARECAARDGDLWIIYMGNNEMVGPFGAATVFGKQAPPLPYVRLVTALQRTRTGQWFAELARKLNHRGAKPAAWGGMQMFLQNQIPPASPLKENVYRNFQKNLDDIVRAGLGSGARVLLNTVAVNLKDCPPFASLLNRNLPPADRARFDQLYAGAEQAEAQSNFTAAVQLYEQAAILDGRDAELQFHWGECLLAQKQDSAAREHLQRACDDDALPFRTDSRLNGLIAAAGEKYAGDRLTFLDTATALAGRTADGVCGNETFYEHVHFDFDGSYRLALAWAQQVEKQLPPGLSRARDWASQPACEQLLGVSDWNRALVIEHMIGRMQVPPLSNQAGNAQRVEGLQARDRRLHELMADTNRLAAARENFLEQEQRRPEDFTLRENFALFLQSVGDLPGATAEWRRVHELIPHDYLAYFQLGRLLGNQSQWPEAEALLRRSVAMHPGLPEAWVELGNVLASQGKFDEALADYSLARQQRPQDAQTAFRMGMIHARLNQPAEAIALYRESARLNPADWQPHFELGGALDAAGQFDEARDEFAAAVKLNPGYSRAHFNYGVLLAKQGRLEEAQQEFEETLRLEPGYANAQDSLAKIRMLEQGAARPK